MTYTLDNKACNLAVVVEFVKKLLRYYGTKAVRKMFSSTFGKQSEPTQRSESCEPVCRAEAWHVVPGEGIVRQDMGCWSTPLCHPEVPEARQNIGDCINPTCHCEGAKRPSQSHYNMPEAVTNSSHLTVHRTPKGTHPNPPSQGKEKHAPQDVTTIKPFNRSTSQPRKLCAFTLAEVLITLAIIGIVAALTIPTLISNYKEKVTVTRVKEAYSMLSHAYNLAEMENGNPKTWDLGTGMYDENAHINLANYFKPYLKLSIDCVGQTDTYTKHNCISSAIFSRSSSYSSVRLNNGVSLIFRVISPSCVGDSYTGKQESCGAIIVNTEPLSGSIKNGVNKFNFAITTRGVVPIGMKGAHLTFERGCNPEIELPYPGFSGDNMYTCTAWVIQNGNMDYLKCPGELSWDGKHKCSD